jgi:hypothetical protein
MNYAKLAAIAFAVLAVTIASIACAESAEKPTVQATLAATQVPTTATQEAGDSQPFIAEPIDLEVLFPLDGETVNTDTLRVLVESAFDSQIDINGAIAQTDIDGNFFADLTLEDGLNFIEVTGINLDGSVDSEQLVVFSDLLTELAALSIVSPQDGAVTVASSILVTGLTSVDSAVQVNGIDVTPNSSGLFEVTVELDPGSNLVEVTAINLSGESVTEELVIFSQPE